MVKKKTIRAKIHLFVVMVNFIFGTPYDANSLIACRQAVSDVPCCRSNFQYFTHCRRNLCFFFLCNFSPLYSSPSKRTKGNRIQRNWIPTKTIAMLCARLEMNRAAAVKRHRRKIQFLNYIVANEWNTKFISTARALKRLSQLLII